MAVGGRGGQSARKSAAGLEVGDGARATRHLEGKLALGLVPEEGGEEPMTENNVVLHEV